MLQKENGIVLFDGVCNLCHFWVNAIIRHDNKKYFRFASIQSTVGKELMLKYHLDPIQFDSVVLIDNNKVYLYSSAILNIARKIGGIYSIAYIFIVIPGFMRNVIYKFIAKNRYKWFGKKETCMLPTPDIKSRFLE